MNFSKETLENFYKINPKLFKSLTNLFDCFINNKKLAENQVKISMGHFSLSYGFFKDLSWLKFLRKYPKRKSYLIVFTKRKTYFFDDIERLIELRIGVYLLWLLKKIRKKIKRNLKIGIIGIGNISKSLIISLTNFQGAIFKVLAKHKKNFPSVKERVKNFLKELKVKENFIAVESLKDLEDVDIVIDASFGFKFLDFSKLKNLKIFIDINKKGFKFKELKNFDLFIFDSLYLAGNSVLNWVIKNKKDFYFIWQVDWNKLKFNDKKVMFTVFGLVNFEAFLAINYLGKNGLIKSFFPKIKWKT